jgi:hypothetical protein
LGNVSLPQPLQRRGGRFAILKKLKIEKAIENNWIQLFLHPERAA